MLFLCIVFSIIVPYLLCSINPAIIVTKIKSGEDIRKLGSGSAGLTNVLRTQGKGAALIVLLGDVSKGVVSILLIKLVFNLLMPVDFLDYTGEFWSAMQSCLYLCVWIGALSAVLGHCFPLYYKFKGGKAVLVTVTTGMVINWLPPLLALTVFIIIVALTKYVSLGSIIAAVAYVIFTWLVGVFLWYNPYWYISVIFVGIIAAILILMHRKNIVRLINKTENKLGAKKKPEGQP